MRIRGRFARWLPLAAAASIVWMGLAQQVRVPAKLGATPGAEADWPMYSLNASETHYSVLNQINTANVKHWATLNSLTDTANVYFRG